MPLRRAFLLENRGGPTSAAGISAGTMPKKAFPLREAASDDRLCPCVRPRPEHREAGEEHTTRKQGSCTPNRAIKPPQRKLLCGITLPQRSFLFSEDSVRLSSALQLL